MMGLEECRAVLERHDAVGALRVVGGPVSHVLFRPEEVHEASSSSKVFAPAREGDVDVANDAGRRGPCSGVRGRHAPGR